MANETTLSTCPAGVDAFYNRVLLERALADICYDKFAQVKPIPLGSSKTARFRKYNGLSANTTPLNEGIVPTADVLSSTDITATVSQYGSFSKITDMVQMTVEDPIITEALEIHGEKLALSLDSVYRDVAAAGTSVRRASGAVGRTSIGAKVTSTDLDIALRGLRSNNAKYISKMIKPGAGYASTPIRPAYFGIAHPYVVHDLEGISGWKSVESYASQGGVYENEVGAYKNLRILETTNAKVWADAGDTYSSSTGLYSTASSRYDVFTIIIFARNGFGVVPLTKQGSKTYVYKGGNTENPLDQYATVGAKAAATAKILNESFVYRIECAASA